MMMGLRMPGMSGVELIMNIRKEFPDARFIVVTIRHGRGRLSRHADRSENLFTARGGVDGREREVVVAALRQCRRTGHAHAADDIALGVVERNRVGQDQVGGFDNSELLPSSVSSNNTG